jgi:hypothetical protein
MAHSGLRSANCSTDRTGGQLWYDHRRSLISRPAPLLSSLSRLASAQIFAHQGFHDQVRLSLLGCARSEGKTIRELVGRISPCVSKRRMKLREKFDRHSAPTQVAKALGKPSLCACVAPACSGSSLS